MKKKTEKQLIQARNTYLLSKTKLVLFTLLFVLGMAQSTKAQFQYGIKAGIGGTCQSELLHLADNTNIRAGYNLGFNTKYRFSEGFALQSGLEYILKGRKVDETDLNIDEKLHYLQLPVRAEFSAGEKAGFKKGQRIYFAAGPYLSYLLDANGKNNGTTFDLKGDTRNFDTGLSLEIGFEFPIFAQHSMQLGLNYDMGFTDVYKTKTDLNNKMAAVSLGFFF
ncbi:MAG: porin family protein [Draconibacterium sp.]